MVQCCLAIGGLLREELRRRTAVCAMTCRDASSSREANINPPQAFHHASNARGPRCRAAAALVAAPIAAWGKTQAPTCGMVGSSPSGSAQQSPPAPWMFDSPANAVWRSNGGIRKTGVQTRFDAAAEARPRRVRSAARQPRAASVAANPVVSDTALQALLALEVPAGRVPVDEFFEGGVGGRPGKAPIYQPVDQGVLNAMEFLLAPLLEHLGEPKPIRLLPWVEKKLPPPWAGRSSGERFGDKRGRRPKKKRT